MTRLSLIPAALAATLFTTALQAHVTPVVVLRKQAEVIRAALPGAVEFFVTNATIGRAELQAINQQAHFTPTSNVVKFFSGRSASGQVVGTVIFEQISTQHGPIEVGVMIDPQGAVGSVMVTRATVELKPSIRAVEQSGALQRLRGLELDAAGHGRLSDDAGLRGMTGYVADAIANAVRRALVLDHVLRHDG